MHKEPIFKNSNNRQWKTRRKYNSNIKGNPSILLGIMISPKRKKKLMRIKKGKNE
jgi:hypothetical protein